MAWIQLLAASFALFLLLLYTLDRGHLSYFVFKAGGSVWPESDKKLIDATVTDFNRIIADFYASGGMPAMIDRFPTTKQIKHEVFRDLGYIRNADRILVYDLASIKPLRIRITGPETAEAQYFEEWNYMYQMLDRSTVTKPLGFGTGMLYQMVKEQGRWLVNDWDPDPSVADVRSKEFKF